MDIQKFHHLSDSLGKTTPFEQSPISNGTRKSGNRTTTYLRYPSRCSKLSLQDTIADEISTPPQDKYPPHCIPSLRSFSISQKDYYWLRDILANNPARRNTPLLS